MFYKNFKKWIPSCETSRFYQDFIQGIAIVRAHLSIAPEQAFREMEKIRLQHRLLRVRKRLFDAYRRLGEQGLNYQGVEAVEVERRVQIGQISQQIENILKNQDQVLDALEQVSSEIISTETVVGEEIKNAK